MIRAHLLLASARRFAMYSTSSAPSSDILSQHTTSSDENYEDVDVDLNVIEEAAQEQRSSRGLGLLPMAESRRAAAG